MDNEVKSDQISLESFQMWKTRALSAELEVMDLLKEQQRLQYLVEELTECLAVR